MHPSLGGGLEDGDPKKEQESWLAQIPMQGPGGLPYGLVPQTPPALSPRARRVRLLR